MDTTSNGPVGDPDVTPAGDPNAPNPMLPDDPTGPGSDVSPEGGPLVDSHELDAAEADGDEEPAPTDDPASPDASDVPGISPLHDDLPGPGS